jgi:transposase-like protein
VANETYQQAIAAAKQRLDENLATTAADVVVLAERFGKTTYEVAKDITADQPELLNAVRMRADRLQKATSEDGTVRTIGRSAGEQAGDARRFFTNPAVIGERKAAIVAEALADEYVAERVAEAIGSDPTLMAAVRRAQNKQIEANREQVAQKRAADPVGRKFDARIALHDLQLVVNTAIQKVRELVPEIESVPKSESMWLTMQADALEDIAAELRHMAEYGESRIDTGIKAVS